MLSLVLHGVGVARLAELVAQPLVRSGQLPRRIEVSATPTYVAMLHDARPV